MRARHPPEHLTNPLSSMAALFNKLRKVYVTAYVAGR